MLPRRLFLTAPLLAGLPASVRARPAPYGVDEIRVAGGASASLQARLGVPVRQHALAGPALARALNAGHLEAAWLDRPTLTLARALMGDRLVVLAARDGVTPVLRRALPAPLRDDVAHALLT